MKVVQFAFYYSKLHIGLILGVMQTPYPLSLRWRWRHWNTRLAVGKQHRY